MPDGSPYILLVEDNPADARTIQRLIDDWSESPHLQVITTGDEALDFFRAVESGEQATPGLVLLDFNLPGTDGRFILKKIKSTGELKRIPVIVLTTSDNPDDRITAYKNGANSYVVKPKKSGEYRDYLKTIKQYWFDVIDLPSRQTNTG